MLGGFAIHLFNGCLYLWGQIAPYVISFFYYFGGKEGSGQKNIDFSYVVFVGPVITAVLAIMNPLNAYFINRFNPRVLIGIGASIGVFAMLLCAKSDSSFSSFLLYYGLIYGLGIGFCYYPPLVCGWQWV